MRHLLTRQARRQTPSEPAAPAHHHTRPGGLPCHEGGVNVLLHDATTNFVLSGGADGCVRLWELARLQGAQPPEGGGCATEVKPAVTVPLPGHGNGGCGVTALVWADPRMWLVQSAAGALLKVGGRHGSPLSRRGAIGPASTHAVA